MNLVGLNPTLTFFGDSMKKRTKVDVMLPMDTVNFLRDVSKLSGVTRDDVINTLLAIKVIQLRETRKSKNAKIKQKSL